MNIRKFQDKDLFSLAGLAEKAEIIDLPKNQISKFLKLDFESVPKKFSIVLIAEDKKQLIGFILLEEYERSKQGIIAEIGYLAVDEQHQGEKVGTKLFDEAVRRLKIKLSQKLFSLHLIKAEVDAKELAAQKFYLSLGMEKAAEIPDYWAKNEAMIIFVKRFN